MLLRTMEETSEYQLVPRAPNAEKDPHFVDAVVCMRTAPASDASSPFTVRPRNERLVQAQAATGAQR